MSDTDEHRAGSVILKDLALFNKAAILFEEKILPAFGTAVSALVSDWLTKHGWKGNASISLSDTWVCPDNWKGEDEEPFAKFRFGIRPGLESQSYLLADLCGVGEADWGFKFEANYSWFGGRAGWNSFAKGLGGLADDVVKKGWINGGKGVFFRSVTLPAGLVAIAWESDDWSEFLAPLERALNAMVADQALFDKIIMQANPKLRALNKTC